MLNEQYKKALYGFKVLGNGGNGSNLFEACEAETQHIYRILMTEKVSVEDIDEAALEKFLTQEMEGKADYSKQVDRVGLQFVNLEKDVEIYPCVGSVYFETIYSQMHRLSSLEAKAILVQLKIMGQLSLITDTMQGLSKKQDGTKLQTALLRLSDVKVCISHGLILPPDLVEKINFWEDLNCSVIIFDFEELNNYLM